jgi:putative ABC transport system ATP-binding protein
MNIIEMKAVKKNYELGSTLVPALRGVDFHVEEGDLLSVVGQSGSGKTTLLNLIGCIDRPTEGSIKVQGEEITKMDDRTITNLRLFKIGFIFQTFNLIPVLNVLENVEFPLLLMRKYAKTQVKEMAEKMIGEVGLKPYIHHKPAELSGGQRQRVAIARALVTKPAIVLADEPTANLDSETGATILELMQEMNRLEKTTFIFSTHDPDVLKYARRMIKLKDGQIVAEELLNNKA